VLLFIAVAAAPAVADILSCKTGPFTANASEESLRKRLGKANVRSEDLHVGEGETESGTVVYPDDRKRRIEILWMDPKTKTSPASLRIDGKGWTTATGIRVGQSLRTVEKHNRRPFRMLGFGWDYGGQAGDWRKGDLASADAPCHLVLWFDAPSSRNVDQVSGDREFSSGHPAMQALDPTIIRIELRFR
jgi:hypothetical protein